MNTLGAKSWCKGNNSCFSGVSCLKIDNTTCAKNLSVISKRLNYTLKFWWLSRLNCSLKRVSLLAALVIASCFFASALPVSAKVTIKTIITPDMLEMGCAFLVEGVIEKGDAAEIAKVIEGFQQDLTHEFLTEAEFPLLDRMCFHSSGGSLIEGLEIAKVLRDLGMGAAVARNHRCESACALAFLGGASLDYVQFLATSAGTKNRLLHPKGLLGFHAPGIEVTGDNRLFSADEAKGLFDLGLSVVFELVSMETDGNLITPSLLLTILGTPNKEMRYVETVGDALRWEIEVGPVGFPEQDPLLGLVYGCMHASKADYYINKAEFVPSGKKSAGLDRGVFESSDNSEFLKERGWKSFFDGFELSESPSSSAQSFSDGNIKGSFRLQDLTSSRLNKFYGLTSCEFFLKSPVPQISRSRFISSSLRLRSIVNSQSWPVVFDRDYSMESAAFSMYWTDERLVDLKPFSPQSYKDYFSLVREKFYSVRDSKFDESSIERPDWCPRAKTNLEKKICGNRDLGRLDVELNRVYAAKKEISGVRKMVGEQMRLRLECDMDEACLQLVYLETLRMLESF